MDTVFKISPFLLSNNIKQDEDIGPNSSEDINIDIKAVC